MHKCYEIASEYIIFIFSLCVYFIVIIIIIIIEL